MKRFLVPVTALLCVLFSAACVPKEKPRPPQNGGFRPPPPAQDDPGDQPPDQPGPIDQPGQGATDNPPPVNPPAPLKNYEYGKKVPGKPGFVTSPYAPASGYIDVRGFPPGQEVTDPYTGKVILVP